MQRLTARPRLAVRARVPDATWGLNVDMLRLTHDALLVSLLCYALPLVGPGATHGNMLAMEIRITNIAARRIAGMLLESWGEPAQRKEGGSEWWGSGGGSWGGSWGAQSHRRNSAQRILGENRSAVKRKKSEF